MSRKINQKDVDLVRGLIAKAMCKVVSDLPHDKDGKISWSVLMLLCTQLVSFAAYHAKKIRTTREDFIKIVAIVVSEEWPRKPGETFPEDFRQ